MTTLSKQRPQTDRQQYHHGDLAPELIRLAIEEIAGQGTDKLSLRSLARKAGVSQAAPYHHFASKNDLFVAIATKGFVELKGRLQSAQAKASAPGEKLLEMGAAYVEFALDNQTIYQVMLGGLIPDFSKHPALQSAAHTCFNELAESVNELLPAEHSELERKQLSGVLLGAIHGISSLQARRNESSENPPKSALGLNAAVASDVKGSLRLLLKYYL
ncbi:MAG: TetR/AcrR family transcriptional regulator [Pseudomonadota bacterium]